MVSYSEGKSLTDVLESKGLWDITAPGNKEKLQKRNL
jgi:hypothetical protein